MAKETMISIRLSDQERNTLDQVREHYINSIGVNITITDLLVLAVKHLESDLTEMDEMAKAHEKGVI